MIKVQSLTKKFGSFTAVKNISFEVLQGEIVGFLGVNGAGKSTTMRMLNSYLTPTAGKITINGFCTYQNSLQARKNIGYMPENTPLPQDLKVNEYLRFRSHLKKVRLKDIKKEINRVIEACLLKEVQNRVIGTLSKGFQQRVGLADALINDPPLLILDEPTVGLDPNQVKHIRQAIKGFGHNHTVLLSSHIMQEVESICDKVIIMHKGQVLVSDSISNLKKSLGKSTTLHVCAKCQSEDLKLKIESLPEVKAIYRHNELDKSHFEIETDCDSDIQEKIFHLFKDCNSVILEMKKQQSTLEDIFTNLTNKATEAEQHEAVS